MSLGSRLLELAQQWCPARGPSALVSGPSLLVLPHPNGVCGRAAVGPIFTCIQGTTILPPHSKGRRVLGKSQLTEWGPQAAAGSTGAACLLDVGCQLPRAQGVIEVGPPYPEDGYGSLGTRVKHGVHECAGSSLAYCPCCRRAVGSRLPQTGTVQVTHARLQPESPGENCRFSPQPGAQSQRSSVPSPREPVQSLTPRNTRKQYHTQS